MSDTPFTPTQGRIVLVRYFDTIQGAAVVRAGIVALTPSDAPGFVAEDHIRVGVATAEVERPLIYMDVQQRTDAEGLGWFRPGDWPQPTL